MTFIPKMMQGVSCPKYGDHNNIIVSEKEVPSPTDTQILVKVHATAITTADSMIRAGTPKFARLFLGIFSPRNPNLGTGYSGKIVKIGENVSSFKNGDNIFGESGLAFSANAEYLCIDEKGVFFKKPNTLTHDQAACICDGALTSYNFLKNIGDIKHDQTILLTSSSS